MASITTAAVGWSVVLLIAGGFYFISNQRKNKNRRTLPAKVRAKSTETRKESKLKKVRKDAALSNTQLEARKVQKAQTTSVEKPASSRGHNIEEEIDNHEFARQLLNVKVGTISRPKSQNSSRPKSVKQGRAQEKHRADSSDNMTGNDADDESARNKLSPAHSMVQIAAGDVSDMLEKAPSQPNVLKINNPIQGTQPEKRKTTKKVEPAETKKQRQNRKKANEAKLLRAQEEQVRKLKLEAQRRTAREAEGRAAKDGSSFVASQEPTSSAWTMSSKTNNVTSVPDNVQLLDTFESIGTNNVSTSEPIYSESEEASSARQDVSALSEEDQVRAAIQETETWSVVKSKEKRNRLNAANDTGLSGANNTVTEKTYAPPKLNSQAVSLQSIRSANISTLDKIKLIQDDLNLEDSEWDVS